MNLSSGTYNAALTGDSVVLDVASPATVNDAVLRESSEIIFLISTTENK